MAHGGLNAKNNLWVRYNALSILKKKKKKLEWEKKMYISKSIYIRKEYNVKRCYIEDNALFCLDSFLLGVWFIS